MRSYAYLFPARQKPAMPATPTYSPLTPQNSAKHLQPYTRKYMRYAEVNPVQPLKGLRETRAVSVSYLASVPAGHGGRGIALFYRALARYGANMPFRITATHPVVPQFILNSEFLILNRTPLQSRGRRWLLSPCFPLEVPLA